MHDKAMRSWYFAVGAWYESLSESAPINTPEYFAASLMWDLIQSGMLSASHSLSRSAVGWPSRTKIPFSRLCCRPDAFENAVKIQ